MPDATSLYESLTSISSRTNEDMSERDVENLFLETGFYDALGYEGTGTDIRSEFTLPDDRRPDYITLDTNEAVTAVYEFKTTGRDLLPHEDQLFHYVENVRAYRHSSNGSKPTGVGWRRRTSRRWKPKSTKPCTTCSTSMRTSARSLRTT
jgi:hypothetical protein